MYDRLCARPAAPAEPSACLFPRRAMRQTLKTLKEGIQAPHFLVRGAIGNQVKECFIKTVLGKRWGITFAM